MFGVEADHSHYGPETQKKLKNFREVLSNYWKLVDSGNFAADLHYFRYVQETWNGFAKTRRLETGFTTYLNAEQYANVNHR